MPEAREPQCSGLKYRFGNASRSTLRQVGKCLRPANSLSTDKGLLRHCCRTYRVFFRTVRRLLNCHFYLSNARCQSSICSVLKGKVGEQTRDITICNP